MSDNQNRGRRRPSREFRGGSGDQPSTSRRPREDEIHEDQPNPKIPKKENFGEVELASKSRSREHGDGQQGRQEGQVVESRSRRSRFDMVQTRPADVLSKTGSQGEQLRLVTNYYRLLKTPSWKIYQYHVDFEPAIEMRHIRTAILGEHRSILGGFLYDGMKLFITKKLPEDKTILKCISKKSQDEYTITLKFVGVIPFDEMQMLQILNIILRKAMQGLQLQLVGRNFFDPVAKINLNEYRLQLWPGYQTSIRQHEEDILLCSEIVHKVMRKETLYDILMRCVSDASDYKEDFRRNVIGLTVLTDYNNHTYRINDVNFESNPKETFEMNGKQVSFIDYYQMKYKIRIRDPKQPLLLSQSKMNNFKRKDTESNLVILIPELCRATGLTDSMRSNFQLMRAMADHTRMNPDKRIERLKNFNQRLQRTPETMKLLNDWNMKLDTSLVELTGRVLNPQRIVFGNNNKVSAGDQADWTRSFRNISVFTTHSRGLTRWSVIYPQRSRNELRNFLECLMRAGDGINMRIGQPTEMLINDDRNYSYLKAMEKCSENDPQLIMLLVPNNNGERYSTIKKKCCLERALPTQIITHRCASNQRGLMSIATKVAIQINCKLGYTPWMIDIPLSGLMTIGYDLARSTKNKSKSFGALVATMDVKTNATFFSTAAECNSNDVLANSLWPMMYKALQQYRSEHNALPKRILFYRDGVSEGSLKQVYEYEVQEIVNKLQEEYMRNGVEGTPMFAYVIVTKSINSRFFNGRNNPPPGTVVDNVVTLPERYDFYLVSQSVRQGTVSPTSYNIVYSTMKLSPDQMQLLTYKMTHLYYNWSGTTRVPAVCQYAKKLASLVATSLHKTPSTSLEKKLYYL